MLDEVFGPGDGFNGAGSAAVIPIVRDDVCLGALVIAAADLQLGPPMEISTSYGYMPPPMPSPMYARDMAQMAPAAPTPVQPGQVEVQASVNIVYSARP